MSLQFLDTNNVPLPPIYRMTANAAIAGQAVPLRFECRDGYYLSAIATEGVAVEARADGDTAWIDIIEDPIDLSPYAPDVSDFEVRVTPPSAAPYDIVLQISETPGQSVINGNDELVINGNNEFVLR